MDQFPPNDPGSGAVTREWTASSHNQLDDQRNKLEAPDREGSPPTMSIHRGCSVGSTGTSCDANHRPLPSGTLTPSQRTFVIDTTGSTRSVTLVFVRNATGVSHKPTLTLALPRCRTSQALGSHDKVDLCNRFAKLPILRLSSLHTRKLMMTQTRDLQAKLER